MNLCRAIFLLIVFLASPAFAIPSITVLSDSSLAVPLSLIVRSYVSQQQVAVAASFASGKDQVAQITEGASADLLITVRNNWIDSLKQQGLVDVYSQTILARNRLVLAGPASFTGEVKLASAFPFTSLLQQAGGLMNLIVGNPESLPEGSFGMEALRRMHALEDVEPFLNYTKQRPEAVEDVAQGGFALLFYTDAAQGRNIRIIDIFPEDSHSPIMYQAVVVAGENMDESRKFLDFLKGPQARVIFKNYGLITD